MSVSITYAETKKVKPDQENLGFGKYFTDYMLVCDYTPETGWQEFKIVPHGDMLIAPENLSLHYGQLIFEGLKAYLDNDGNPVMFRPIENFKRLNRSAQRLCMPEMNVEDTLNAVKSLIQLEKDWIPTAEGSALYIRPFMIATDNALGVRPSNNYRFITLLSPVGSYYKGGLNPTKIYVEDEYVRAVAGGTGEAKCAGNYAGSMASQIKANEKGYDQVLWLDAAQRKYVEEVGTSNLFLVINGEVVTPELSGSILPGITRDSTIKLLRHLGEPVVERKVTIEEVMEGIKNGEVTEAFATGTAAVISPIGLLRYKDDEVEINNLEPGEIAMKAYEGITGIQHGEKEDVFGWLERI